MIRLPGFSASAATLLVCLATPAFSQTGRVRTDLGLPPGTQQSQAIDINDAEQIVGGTTQGTGMLTGAGSFIWTRSQGLQPIGSGAAVSINEQTTVAGWIGPRDPYAMASMWTPVGGLVPLTLGEPWWSAADGINEAGTIVGSSLVDASAFTFHPFLWRPGIGAIDFGTLGGTSAFAFDINDLGQVVGASDLPNGQRHAFLRHPNGLMIDLGTLGGGESSASAINNRGQVVGRSRTPSGADHAFLWTSRTGMQDLGTLGGDSNAADINEQGQVVGSSTTANGTIHAFLWSSEHGMRDLEGPGGPETFAFAINNKGTIVGRVTVPNAGIPPSVAHAAVWRQTRDVLVDFGPANGVWTLSGDSTWAPVHGLSPRSTAVADLDGDGDDEVVMDFGPAAGVWVWFNRSEWRFLHSLSPDLMVAADLDRDGTDELVVVFPGLGLWRWSAGAWTRLHHLQPTSVTVGTFDGTLGDDLVVDVPGEGLLMLANGRTWSVVHPFHASAIVAADRDGDGQQEVVVDFGAPYGIWAYRHLSGWTQVHAMSARHLAAGDLDGNGPAELIVDFGAPHGIWISRGVLGWTPLHGRSAEGLTVGDRDGTGKDDVLVNFGDVGLWEYANDSAWRAIHAIGPEEVRLGRLH